MLDLIYWNNSLLAWILALSTFIILFILLSLILKFINNRLQDNYKSSLFPLLILSRHTRALFLLLLAIYAASSWLVLPEKVIPFLKTIFMIALWIQIGVWGHHLISYLVENHSRRGVKGEGTATFGALKLILRIALWVLVAVLVADNIPGLQVTALITSLGIGGIAIGLAVQNILSDLFSSLSITLDKPFVIDDLIQVDDLIGTVEKIGLKSTRIRSQTGEQIIFSNSDLLNSRIKNFKRLERRRNFLRMNISYKTPPELLEKIPLIIQNIFQKHEELALERMNLAELGDFSLIYELVYWVNTADFNLHVSKKHLILAEILNQFNQNGIKIATLFPPALTERK